MKLRNLLAIAAGITVTGLAAADYEQVRERLSTLISPDSEFVIAETPIDGLIQVRVGSEVIYMTDDGRYLFQGRVLDLDTRTDLTDVARAGMRRELIAGIDSAEMIRFGPDDADHELLVFTDPDCGYCRRLHQQIAEYNDAGIGVNYLAFPRAGVGSGTFDTLVSVWCAPDQHGAMDRAKAGRDVEPQRCDSPVEEQYQLGQSMGVTGTPALMTMNGDLIPGYVPPDQLRDRLDRFAEAASAGDPTD